MDEFVTTKEFFYELKETYYQVLYNRINKDVFDNIILFLAYFLELREKTVTRFRTFEYLLVDLKYFFTNPNFFADFSCRYLPGHFEFRKFTHPEVNVEIFDGVTELLMEWAKRKDTSKKDKMQMFDSINDIRGIVQKNKNQAKKEHQDCECMFGASPQQIHEYLSQHIIGQDEHLDELSLIMYEYLHFMPENESKPMNILLTGESGVGKSYFAEVAARAIGAAFVRIDICELSPSGYSGKSTIDYIRKIKKVASENPNKKIVCAMEEVDKIALPQIDIEGNNTNVQTQSTLLALMEGGVYDHDLGFPTNRILFIWTGAYTLIREEKMRLANHMKIGFGADEEDRIEMSISDDDLIKSGVMSEFLRRIDRVIHLNSLSESDILSILKLETSDYSRKCKYFSDLYGFDVSLDDDDLIETVKSVDMSLGGYLGAVNRKLSEKLSKMVQRHISL